MKLMKDKFKIDISFFCFRIERLIPKNIEKMKEPKLLEADLNIYN